MKENEWLRFEKSGRVSDYLTYCQSDTGKYNEYGMCRNQEENYGARGDCQSNNPGNSEYGKKD